MLEMCTLIRSTLTPGRFCRQFLSRTLQNGGRRTCRREKFLMQFIPRLDADSIQGVLLPYGPADGRAKTFLTISIEEAWTQFWNRATGCRWDEKRIGKQKGC